MDGVTNYQGSATPENSGRAEDWNTPGLTAEDMKGDPRYDVDALLAGYGLTMDDIKDPARALVQGGVERFYAVNRVMSNGLIGKVRAAAHEKSKSTLQKLQEEEDDTRDPRRVAELRALMEKEESQPPLPGWRSVSGLGDAETERNMAPKVRDEAIKRLLEVVGLLAAHELKAHAENPRPERTHLWDPLPQICFYLGIARAKLSRYSKELTGMAAHEIIDRMRARPVKEMLRGKILAFIQSGTVALTSDGTSPLTPGPSPTRGEGRTAAALEYYKALKEARRDPSWSRETFAMDLGFANYRRFYRACLLYYGKTPGQLEFEIIGEVLKDGLSQRREEAKNGEEKAKDDVQFFTRSTPLPGPLPSGGERGTISGENRAAG